MAQLIAPVVAGLSAAAPALQIGGTLLSAAGMISQGRSQQAAADFQARQLEQNAKTEQAAAQREAQEERRQKELMISRARAVGAASGGGQDYNLLGDLEAEGEYAALTSLWTGEERARGRNLQASSAVFEGLQRKRASMLNAGSTLLSGGSSFLQRYG